MSFILSILFSLLSAIWDASLIKYNNYILDHMPRFIFRIIVLTLMGFFDLKNTLIAYFGFFLTFDYALNYYLGRPILSLGNTAKWDLFWKGKEKLLLGIRIIAFIAILVIELRLLNI